jgi:hypothetical protein
VSTNLPFSELSRATMLARQNGQAKAMFGTFARQTRLRLFIFSPAGFGNMKAGQVWLAGFLTSHSAVFSQPLKPRSTHATLLADTQRWLAAPAEQPVADPPDVKDN